MHCSYQHCESPEESSQFYQIREGTAAGGQDWSSLAGSVLCQACYQRFKKKGTLERTVNRPLAASARRCTYEHCDSPEQSRNFYQIKKGKTSGGRDWSSLAGSVLCKACYSRFKRGGTLERTANKPLAASARRCTYEHCDSPEESSKFHQIGEGTAAGGQDWRSLVGSVLCAACYKRFLKKGTLERAQNRPLAASARRCTYEHCDRPEESSKFYQIGEGKTSGGRDWSSIVGSVLCAACYDRFKNRGTLHRCDSRPSKKQKTSRPPRQQPQALGTSIHADSSISDGESESSEQPEEEEEMEEDTGECMVCLGEGRAMCIVPCGHFGLCGDCGDEGLFEDVDISSSMKEGGGSSSRSSSSRRGSNSSRRSSSRGREVAEERDEEEEKKKKKKRPFEVCPICCEEMCWPWVMTRGEWVWMGGTVYDA